MVGSGADVLDLAHGTQALDFECCESHRACAALAISVSETSVNAEVLG